MEKRSKDSTSRQAKKVVNLKETPVMAGVEKLENQMEQVVAHVFKRSCWNLSGRRTPWCSARTRWRGAPLWPGGRSCPCTRSSACSGQSSAQSPCSACPATTWVPSAPSSSTAGTGTTCTRGSPCWSWGSSARRCLTRDLAALAVMIRTMPSFRFCLFIFIP